MLQLEVSARARADLAEIREYGAAEFGRVTGDAYVLGFDKLFDQLMEFPNSGVAVPGDKRDRRMFRYRSHFVFYRVFPKALQIVRVLHATRDARRHLE